MSEYHFPFESHDFDVIYTYIAETLKVKYPQQQNETIVLWYRRLLYELLSYVQSQFEPVETETIIPPKNKNNKKKQNSSSPDIVEPLFSENIERALEIIYQDSNFAIYLLSWFLPILVSNTDTFKIDITVDNSDTPAETVSVKSVNILLEQGMFKASIYVNGKKINSLSENEYNTFSTDPFLSAFLKAAHFFEFGNINCSYESTRNINMIFDFSYDPQMWSFKLCRFFWSVKNILAQLYIEEIDFKTSLEPATVTILKKNKSNKNKNSRRRFNEQKYINTSMVTEEQMSAQIIRTLVISTFRTFYDFDEETISPELFGYLFEKKRLSY